MKRHLALLLTLLLLASVLLTACGENNPATTSSEGEGSEMTDETPKPVEKAKNYWSDVCKDESAGLSSASDVYGLKIYENGAEAEDAAASDSNDVRLLLAGENATRFVNYAEGYALTLPGNAVEADLSLGGLRSVLKGEGWQVTLTYENQNPYGKQQDGSISKDGFDLYMEEWFERQLINTNYLTANKIIRTRPLSEVVIGNFTVKEYCMQINLAAKMDYQRYNLAVIRPTNTYNYFYFLLFKTENNLLDEFDAMLTSFCEIEKKGKPTGTIKSYHLKENPAWNAETKAYFQKLVNQTNVDFGAFPEGHDGEYADWLFSEEGIGKPDVYMTYQHMGWGSADADFSESFVRAAKYAGGDGFNGKPIFNLTYQFTYSNNGLGGYTPVFDILRTKKDDYFRSLAKAIKNYGHPVLFRLNNEMNTDWTDYCGMMTLMDPDNFVNSWRRMYDIFTEEGVDNCIWIFNPISTSCPYSNWGDAMCYMPGEDYVQMLGLTNYQMNNGTTNAAPPSFKAMYTETASKMLPWFDEYPWIIGEFACGAGSLGYYDWGKNAYVRTVQGRNAALQTAWVRGMIDCFDNNQKDGYDFCKRIKVAIWFSANDYAIIDAGGSEYECINYLKLDEGVSETIALLRDFMKK